MLAGSGSGAMVLCDPMVDPRGGALTLGLGLLEQLAVIPHHDTWSEDKAKRTLRIAPERAAHRRHRRAHRPDPRPDGAWRVAGAGSVIVYLDGAEADLAALP